MSTSPRTRVRPFLKNLHSYLNDPSNNKYEWQLIPEKGIFGIKLTEALPKNERESCRRSLNLYNFKSTSKNFKTNLYYHESFQKQDVDFASIQRAMQPASVKANNAKTKAKSEARVSKASNNSISNQETGWLDSDNVLGKRRRDTGHSTLRNANETSSTLFAGLRRHDIGMINGRESLPFKDDENFLDFERWNAADFAFAEELQKNEDLTHLLSNDELLQFIGRTPEVRKLVDREFMDHGEIDEFVSQIINK
jgi:hypothetical protein